MPFCYAGGNKIDLKLTRMNMSPVVHFEMPYEDRERMADFYTKVFGWKTQMMGSEMGEYVAVQTGEVDEKSQMPKQPGMINGGFFKKGEQVRPPSVVISVQDIRQAMQELQNAGGKILEGKVPGEPTEIPGIGWYVAFEDTEGNRVGMLQPVSMPPSV